MAKTITTRAKKTTKKPANLHIACTFETSYKEYSWSTEGKTFQCPHSFTPNKNEQHHQHCPLHRADKQANLLENKTFIQQQQHFIQGLIEQANTKEKDCNLSFAIFKNLNLNNIEITKNLLLYQAQIGGDANLREAQIGGDAYLMAAQIGGHAYLMAAKIGGHAYLMEAKIGGDAFLSKAQIGGDAFLSKAQIGGDAYLSEAKIGGDANLSEAQIGSGVYLLSIEKVKTIYLNKLCCHYLSISGIKNASLLSEHALWQRCIIKNNDFDSASFVACSIAKPADFETLFKTLKANIQTQAEWFAGKFLTYKEIQANNEIKPLLEQQNNKKIADFYGKQLALKYKEMNIEKLLNKWDFSGSVLRNMRFTDCDLSATHFLSSTIADAEFDACEFAKISGKQGLADHTYIIKPFVKNRTTNNFYKTFLYWWRKLRGKINLIPYDYVHFLDTDDKKARKSEEHKNSFKQLQAAYLRFKRYFEAEHDYERANEFHYQEMSLRRFMNNSGWLNRRVLWFYRETCDYGMNWLKPFLLIILFFFSFGFALSFTHCVSKPINNNYSIQIHNFSAEHLLPAYSTLGASILPTSLGKSLGISNGKNNDTKTEKQQYNLLGNTLIFLHFLISASLFTLFILSLRRRFKR